MNISERTTVQHPLINYASQIGWQIVSREEAEQLRGGTQGLLFSSVLKEKLIALNPGLIDSENFREVIQKIESVRYDITGNKNALGWLRGEKSVFSEKEKRELNVSVFDYANPDNNVFQVTDEWHTPGTKTPHRADVMFLINGIPVCVAETKSHTVEEGVWKGLTQTRQYHTDTPAMMALPQLFEITNLSNFHYGVTWNTEAKALFNWKDEQDGNFERKVKAFFDRERFLKLIERWVLFYQRDDELKKTVLRQHQTRAAERIENRCADSAKRRGLIWHTQGSGKTFTMIKAAELVLENAKKAGDPTVILMMDRNELEGQLSGWLESLFPKDGNTGMNVRQAGTKKELKEILKSDFRGLVVSMIHKFDDMPANMSERENIFVFIDEAHRSVEGDLGNHLTGALPNATLIGFTGTPTDRTAHGRGTFKVFGKDDKNGYLDKYSIMESIRDGTTVELKYQLAPLKMRVPEERLEREFLEMAAAEGLNDIEKLNKVLEKAVSLKNFLKADARVPQVADFVAKHFKENVEPSGYKAFLVAVDREACALYKRELDKRLDPETVKAVYSEAQHDTQTLPLVAKYQLSEDEEKSFRKEFTKADRNPKLFIVTDKLLTGFDAPVLYCMYLDKPMRDHVLLQSIARVNRPYSHNGTEKPCGLIVDFVGVLANMKKALAFESGDVSGVIENIEVLFESFKKKMDEARPYLKTAEAAPARHSRKGGNPAPNDKTVENIIEYFSDKEKRREFLEFFRELQSLYEILSPDARLSVFLKDYKNLCQIYDIVMKEFERNEMPVEYREFQEKTKRLVIEEVGVYKPDRKEIETVINEEALAEIAQSGKSDSLKINNLLKVLFKLIQDPQNTLVLISIEKKARNIKERHDNNLIAAREVAEQLNGLAHEGLELKRRFEESGKSARRFVFMIALENAGDPKAEENAGKMEKLFNHFPNHTENIHQKRSLKSALYKIAGPAVGEKKESSVIKEIMELDGRFKKEVQG